MASDIVYDAIKAEVNAAWNTAPIAWENEIFDRPALPAIWVAFEITGTFYGQETIGAGVQSDNRWDEEGVMFFHVMAPVGSGSSLARKYGKQLADLFKGKTLLGDSLEFLEGAIGSGERGDDKGVYWRVTVTIDWRLWGE